jgi:PhnB protein
VIELTPAEFQGAIFGWADSKPGSVRRGEAAFKFYAQCLGGQPGARFRYAETPLANQVPADWSDKVMHGSLTLGD